MATTSRDFQNLQVWQKSHQLTLRIYEATREFPVDERFGMTSQMRRAAASIPANIAEGCGRGGRAELVRFLRIAQGSASELAYQVLLARDLAFLPEDTSEQLSQRVDEIGRMLNGYMKKVSDPSNESYY